MAIFYMISIYTIAFALFEISRADEVQYFGDSIDYWHETKSAAVPKQANEPKTKNVKSVTAQPSPLATESFEWGKYLDPKNKEFFKEGDYTPPEPFMEIVRNPSDQNIKMWFSYIEKKNELFARLEKRIKEYGGSPTITSEFSAGASKQKTSEVTDVKRFRFRMYFDSQCPHCKKMFSTMVALQEKGFFVEARQVDRGQMEGLPFPTERASASELKGKDIQSVPLLLIGDLKNKVVYRITGFQSLESVMGQLSEKAGL
jgi:thiol-disulfide isomerase/thioredoxin